MVKNNQHKVINYFYHLCQCLVDLTSSSSSFRDVYLNDPVWKVHFGHWREQVVFPIEYQIEEKKPYLLKVGTCAPLF